MSSFLNKIASTVTNSTGAIIGRENLTKLSNGINKSLFLKSKYREFMKAGNTIELISKSSHMSLHICASQNDPNRLILLGNGQIGPEFTNAHFLIELDTKNNHYKFRNSNNFICFDNEIPCILSEKINPKHKHEAIRARNEFRLHEMLGSEEFFALESVYFPGRYIAVLADGSITITKNKGDEKAQFCIHVINVNPHNIRPNSSASNVYRPPQPVVVSVSEAGPSGASAASSRASVNLQSKEEEQAFNFHREPEAPTTEISDTPPTYTNLFPKLP